MNTKRSNSIWFMLPVALIIIMLMVTGCATGSAGVSESTEPSADAEVSTATDEHNDDHEEDEHEHASEGGMLMLPELPAAELNDGRLRVVATTSIIGDVVMQVGGQAIDLTILIGPGQDAHSYQPAARDLTAVANAHLILINGWNLEEGLVDDLENIGEDVPVVPISANIEPIAFGDDAHDDHDDEHDEGEHEDEHEEDAHEDEHGHSGADPHVWFNIHNVEQWVENIEHLLSELDPANADTYQTNAAAYTTALAELEAYTTTQLDTVPEANRFLVTNHDSFSYFAEEYGFTVLGTVIPSVSTVAEPSASDLVDLITEMEEHNVCTLFTETTVNDDLAQTVAAELNGCETVQVLKLYTGSVGPEGSNIDSYIKLFRANIDTLVSGLK